jgi:hypothetical protein
LYQRHEASRQQECTTPGETNDGAPPHHRLCIVLLYPSGRLVVQGAHELQSNALGIGALQGVKVQFQGIREVIVQVRVSLLDIADRQGTTGSRQGRARRVWR